MDGSPNGRIKCSLDNWVGKVYLIPRTEIHRSKNRSELNQTGVYLLFGNDTESGEELLYVGQARERKNGNGVLARVAEHLGEEKLDYFTHSILIIDSDNSFGPTEISYLENAFYQHALVADRVRAVNSNDPSPGNVTEEKKAALDEFIANAKIPIGSLGYRVFDAVDDAKVIAPESPALSPKVEPLLYLKAAGACGTGRQTNDGFVILAGATLREGLTESAPESVKKNRQRFADRVSADHKLLRDTLFTSPSTASSFLIGASTSGKTSWKNSDGVTLRALEQAELGSTNSS
ncbi:GIY-YIG nuclease family protein [Corynebacterium sp. ES2715-CONJ3]|uniref:GIY-YIG nuclease family protein n=1 Tax=Corynebacterium sp. ES2715-CONJ3 TaxID=2974028 RepID=UPI002169008E|nr:GIY-YIG nuclease family protein [Corynebacterium sp. ES2715-CONJ3]MCS4492171.1 GIY-YIG nuclease family protein [Corynebacterium sp. ES2715-CONJ3]